MDYYFLHGPALRPTRASKTLLFPSPLLPQTERKSAKRSYCEPGDPDADSCIARTAISATDEEPGPPGDSDAALVHEILWNHFGFIPCSPGLDGEAYKLRSPSPQSRVRSRDIDIRPFTSDYHHHRRSRTSSSDQLSSLPSMAKKRRSLSSILVPPFTQASTSTSASTLPSPTGRSHTVSPPTSNGELTGVEDSTDWLSFYSGAISPTLSEFTSLGSTTPSRNSPPPDLLDEDPFANLSPAPSLRASRATSPVRTVLSVFSENTPHLPPTPRSPLAQSALEQDGARRARSLRGARSLISLRDLPSTPPPSPIEPTRPRLARRHKSSGPPQVRSAYTRPAFEPRPSLPSLNTLARTSINVPKVRRGRPGAQLPLEPWEDQGLVLTAPPSPTYTREYPTSPVARRRHLRRPTLSMIRDSRMYLDGDGESAEDGGIPPLDAPQTKETPFPMGTSGSVQDAQMTSASISSLLDIDNRRFDDPDDEDKPPTPPPKSPSLIAHARSTSGTSTTSTVPSLCPSSPTSWSTVSTESQLLSRSPTHTQSPLPQSHPHVLVDGDHSGPPGYSDLFAHHRNTQLFASDLMATLDYDYSEALSHLGTPGRKGMPPSALFPSGEFEPGSSAGTIKDSDFARVPLSDSRGSDESAEAVPMTRMSSGGFPWTHESASKVSLSPLSPPELLTSSSEDVSADNSACQSPALGCLSRSSRSSSTVSSEYDFGEDEDVCYTYDIGSFHDPLGTPSSPQRRPVFGYGIPWPSTRRTSGSSGGSAGSGGSLNDVLSDLEDLAEDVTERFTLRSSGDSVRDSSASYYGGEEDVFGGGEMADAPGGGYSSSSRRSGRPSGGSGQGQSGGYSNGNGHSGNVSGGWNGHGGTRGGGGDDGDSDDERRRRPTRLPNSSHGAASDSESDSEESGTDDYGEDSPGVKRRRERHDTTRPGMHSPLPPTSPLPAADSTDDDVPLAQQIPGALKAQRTIRRQVRDELDQKRAERRAKRAQKTLLQQQGGQRPSRTLSSAADSAVPAQQSSPSKPVGRPRTKTLPSNMNSPFSAGDLTQKLLGLQTSTSQQPPSGVMVPVPPMAPRSKRPSFDSTEPSSSFMRGRTINGDSQMYSASASASRATSRPPADTSRSLRPMRSFHRPRNGESDLAPPLPISDRTSPPQASASVQRAATSGSRRRPDDPSSRPPPLDRTRSVKSDSSRRPSVERTPPPPPPLPTSHYASHANEGFVVTSRNRSATTTSGPSATASPAPASTFSQPGRVQGAGQMWQQRVFIGNMQRFCLVEIGSGTSAGDVLNMVDGQGSLDQAVGSGGWMLWEVSQDFGMERPIRNFEMLSGVCGSWNSDKTVNLLVIKKTLLAPLLSLRAMPLSSPTCTGYVQWEHKRGKWQKRWMELREHSLWLSKRDTGKDATFLCSLNNFDAYYVTRVHKAPKPYVFSVKSTDSLTYFENTADYVHVFSCGESEGKNWLEKILLARSYVLYQERNIVSTSAAGSGSTTSSALLQRAGTRKRPAQPLLSVGPPKAEMVAPSSFEPSVGSLLARR